MTALNSALEPDSVEDVATDLVASGEVVAIAASSSNTPGRYWLQARHNILVTDARASSGGPGLAVAAGELLLSSLASCSFGLMEEKARELGFALRGLQAQVLFERDLEDSTRYARLELNVQAQGVQQAQAEQLLAYFTGKCPIYNTLRRGGPMTASITAVPGI